MYARLYWTCMAVHMHKELKAREREKVIQRDKEHTTVTCAAVMFSVDV